MKMKEKSASPLYAQIMDELTRDITIGRFRVGDMIPTETELCERFHVSRITVRRAVEELSEQGILSRKQGKGTFVTKPLAQHKIPSSVFSFHTLCENAGKKPSVVVFYQREELASKDDQAALQLKSGSKVVSISRLCFADEVPVIYTEQRFSMAYSYLLDNDLTASIYSLISNCGSEASSSFRTMSLVYATEEIAKKLNVKTGDALILLHFIVYDRQGRPMNITDAYVRGDIFPLQYQ